MPRTKKVQAPKRIEGKETKMKELALKMIDEEEKKVMAAIDIQIEEELNALNICYVREKTNYPLHMLNRTIREIVSGELDSTLNSTKASNKTNQTLVSSRTIKKSKRSMSACCEDEGYTTAESTRGTTSGDRTTRLSRSKTRTASKPTSRSLSRTTVKKAATYFTPANKQPSKDVGAITPKCKPNTPQIIVRRPKVGEMAWSNQGSPLMTTHTIATEQLANVNIPLPDGNVVSLLPQRGVRVSQIPNIDYDTRRQLEILRDNLIKVCSEYKQDE